MYQLVVPTAGRRCSVQRRLARKSRALRLVSGNYGTRIMFGHYSFHLSTTRLFVIRKVGTTIDAKSVRLSVILRLLKNVCELDSNWRKVETMNAEFWARALSCHCSTAEVLGKFEYRYFIAILFNAFTLICIFRPILIFASRKSVVCKEIREKTLRRT